MKTSVAIFLKTGEKRSSRPFALFELALRPLLDYAMDAASVFDETPVLLLSGSRTAPVAAYLRDAFPGARVLQGDGALKKWRQFLDECEACNVLISEGNRPFVDKRSLNALVSLHEKKASHLTFRGSCLDRPAEVVAAVVDMESLRFVLQELIRKGAGNINSASNLVSVVLESPIHLAKNNREGIFQLCEPQESCVVSDLASLAKAETAMQDRLRRRILQQGVKLLDPDSVYFSFDTTLGKDTVVEPHVFFAQGVRVGRGVRIRAFSHLQGCRIADFASIGPYARLRPESKIGRGARIGNFVEIKQSDVGAEAKIGHLSYIGDARIGARANIGAGVVTCNFDGNQKNMTWVGQDAFIGSNASLVAPVRIGRSAYVGAGSVITKDVKAMALSLERSEQIVRPGWAGRRGKSDNGKSAVRKRKGG